MIRSSDWAPASHTPSSRYDSLWKYPHQIVPVIFSGSLFKKPCYYKPLGLYQYYEYGYKFMLRNIISNKKIHNKQFTFSENLLIKENRSFVIIFFYVFVCEYFILSIMFLYINMIYYLLWVSILSIQPPGATPNPTCFTITSSASSIWITTDFGMIVEFKPWHTFYITVPGEYR